MSGTLDLNLLPIARQAGQDQAELPGLYAVTPPRRTARGRSEDNLILYLSEAGNAPLPPDQLRQLMENLTRAYYKTAGSVTAAMRSLVEALNQTLLERNLKLTSSGRQSLGQLIVLVLRGQAAYLAYSGPASTYLVTAEATEQILDAEGAGRGLGISRTTNIRFAQAELHNGDFIVLACQAPPAWTVENLRLPTRPSLESMRRRLLDHATPQFSAVLIQVQAGEGKLRLLRRKSALTDMAQPVQPSPAPATGPVDSPVETSPITPDASGSAESAGFERGEPVSQAPLAEQPALPAESPPVSLNSEEDSPAAFTFQSPASSGSLPPSAVPRPRATTPSAASAATHPASASDSPKIQKKRFKHLAAPLVAGLAAFWQALGNTLGLLLRGLASTLKKILPDESILHISPSTMFFIALMVPVIISTVGGFVYIRRGRAAQHQAYMEQASQSAAQASTAVEPDVQRAAWTATLGYLDKAELFDATEQSAALRAQAMNTLDSLDGILRLDYQPAIAGGLGEEVKVTQMAATPTDLYMINANQGIVLRATLTGRGYEMDPNFKCGPGFGPELVGPILDIVPLPAGSVENATILAMDANANLLYCLPDGSEPLYKHLSDPTNTALGSPIALALDNNDLYVLDPQTNGVYIYFNMDVTQPPNFYFGDDVPEMQDVIDLTVSNDFLFLLHSDGRLTKCSYSGFAESPTRCEDPANYDDPRPGRSGGVVIPDALFSQFSSSPHPGPVLYMLEPTHQSVYMFSLRQTFQQQYRPATDLGEEPATSFAVSTSRLIFLAINNQVYYAGLP